MRPITDLILITKLKNYHQIDLYQIVLYLYFSSGNSTVDSYLNICECLKYKDILSLSQTNVLFIVI